MHKCYMTLSLTSVPWLMDPWLLCCVQQEPSTDHQNLNSSGSAKERMNGGLSVESFLEKNRYMLAT